MVAAHQHQHELLCFAFTGDQRHRLHRALQLDAEQRRDVLAGFLGRGVDLAHGFTGSRARCRIGGDRRFHVRGVVRTGGEHQRVLAGIGDDVEFLRGIATDRTGVGLHHAEVQAEAGEDAAVGRLHVLVFAHQALIVQVERIGVLHQKFARTHHAEARADLVAELGLHLVEVHRQLLVAGQLAAREVAGGFFGGRAVAEHLVLAVLDLQQLRAELLPAAGLLPQFLRLDGRDLELHGTGAVHFLAHDAFNLAQHAQAQRRPGVQARCQLADHARAQHQPVAGELGVAGGFLGGVQVELGEAHRRLRITAETPILPARPGRGVSAGLRPAPAVVPAAGRQPQKQLPKQQRASRGMAGWVRLRETP